jgi:hypothetical protein
MTALADVWLAYGDPLGTIAAVTVVYFIFATVRQNLRERPRHRNSRWLAKS